MCTPCSFRTVCKWSSPSWDWSAWLLFAVWSIRSPHLLPRSFSHNASIVQVCRTVHFAIDFFGLAPLFFGSPQLWTKFLVKTDFSEICEQLRCSDSKLVPSLHLVSNLHFWQPACILSELSERTALTSWLLFQMLFKDDRIVVQRREFPSSLWYLSAAAVCARGKRVCTLISLSVSVWFQQIWMVGLVCSLPVSLPSCQTHYECDLREHDWLDSLACCLSLCPRARHTMCCSWIAIGSCLLSALISVIF